MTDALNAVSAALGLTAKVGDLLRSLYPVAARLKPRIDLEKLAEDFFQGDILSGAFVRVRGVLFPYNCLVIPVAYAPLIVGSSAERVKSSIFDTASGKSRIRAEVSMTLQTLSPPVLRFNDIELNDQTQARIAWLYPEHFNGLIFERYSAERELYDLNELREILSIRSEQRPILCLLPTTGQYDFYGKCVEATGMIRAADPQIASLVSGSLDQFRTDLFSRCIQPFEDGSSCLAIDLREGAQVKIVSQMHELGVVLGVQGVIELPDATTGELLGLMNVALDAVPDRTGMGPLRALGFGGETASVLSNGDVRWMFNRNALTVAAYREVNMVDRENVTRSTAELVHHWQAWQKRARSAVQSAIGRVPSIRPLFIWDPTKITMFNSGGFQLPRRLEAQLFNADPGIRKAIDWLCVGTGRYSSN